jgi:hypothetical protein
MDAFENFGGGKENLYDTPILAPVYVPPALPVSPQVPQQPIVNIPSIPINNNPPPPFIPPPINNPPLIPNSNISTFLDTSRILYVDSDRRALGIYNVNPITTLDVNGDITATSSYWIRKDYVDSNEMFEVLNSNIDLYVNNINSSNIYSLNIYNTNNISTSNIEIHSNVYMNSNTTFNHGSNLILNNHGKIDYRKNIINGPRFNEDDTLEAAALALAAGALLMAGKEIFGALGTLGKDLIKQLRKKTSGYDDEEFPEDDDTLYTNWRFLMEKPISDYLTHIGFSNDIMFNSKKSLYCIEENAFTNDGMRNLKLQYTSGRYELLNMNTKTLNVNQVNNSSNFTLSNGNFYTKNNTLFYNNEERTMYLDTLGLNVTLILGRFQLTNDGLYCNNRLVIDEQGRYIPIGGLDLINLEDGQLNYKNISELENGFNYDNNIFEFEDNFNWTDFNKQFNQGGINFNSVMDGNVQATNLTQLTTDFEYDYSSIFN